MSEYYILCGKMTREGEKVSFKKVQGQPVVIGGFESFHFFVHKYGDTFAISEATTGSRILAGYKKRELVFATKRFLDKHGPDVFKTVIAQTIEKYGASPWKSEGGSA